MGHYPASRAALVAGIVSAHQVLKTMNLQIPVVDSMLLRILTQTVNFGKK